MVSLLLIQASGLVVVKETNYPGKRSPGVVAYSVPLAILLDLTYSGWLEVVVVALIALRVYRRIGKETVSCKTVLKLVVIFSIAAFNGYVMPLYAVKISQQAYDYLSVATRFE